MCFQLRGKTPAKEEGESKAGPDADAADGGAAALAAIVLPLCLWACCFGIGVNPLPRPRSAPDPDFFAGIEASAAETSGAVMAGGVFLFGAASSTSAGSAALAFLRREASRLVDSARRPPGPGAMCVLDGARAIAMLMILLFHCFCTVVMCGSRDDGGAAAAKDLWARPWPALLAVKHADLLGVETFLVVSGLVTFHSLSKPAAPQAEQRPAAVARELRNFLWQRWLRLAPPMLAMLALLLLLHPKNCPQCADAATWASVMLFTNNHEGFWVKCGFQTWYCALQMQLYLVGAPLMLLLRRLLAPPQAAPRPSKWLACAKADTAVASADGRPSAAGARAAWLLLLCLAVASIATRAAAPRRAFDARSQTVAMRGTAFVAGVAVAVALRSAPPQADELPTPRRAAVGGRGSSWWSSALDCLALAVVAAAAAFGSQDAPVETWPLWALRVFMPPALDAAIARTLWACLRGRLRAVSAVLSWRWWRPVSAVSYSAFLLQFLVIDRTFNGPWATVSAEPPARTFAASGAGGRGGVVLCFVALAAVAVPVTLVLGALVHIAVEAPVRDLCRPAARKALAPRRVLSGAAASVAALLLAAVLRGRAAAP